MTRWATLAALLLGSCRNQPAPSPAAAPAESCLDRQLRSKGLNPFGDPEGTLYAGGTPLFDEKSGRSAPREEYVARKHPELVRACGSDAGP
jgi:hypothetical protein